MNFNRAERVALDPILIKDREGRGGYSGLNNFSAFVFKKNKNWRQDIRHNYDVIFMPLYYIFDFFLEIHGNNFTLGTRYFRFGYVAIF